MKNAEELISWILQTTSKSQSTVAHLSSKGVER
jgi:hypothetical protein